MALKYKDYANTALDLIISAMDSHAIATNKCPKCGGPFPCIPCDAKVRARIDEEVKRLREYYRGKGDPRGSL